MYVTNRNEKYVSIDDKCNPISPSRCHESAQEPDRNEERWADQKPFVGVPFEVPQ